MIHGDVKPKNVLVFKQEASTRSPEIIYAKLADFGYAGWNKDPDTDVFLYLPRSRPWAAPEYHHRAFDLYGAKQLDIFSLGLTCLWILFHDSEIVTHSSMLQKSFNVDNLASAIALCHETVFEDPKVVEKLKHDGLLPTLAEELVHSTNLLNEYEASKLDAFFSLALCQNPDQRSLSTERLAMLADYNM
jgi:serine/threonine protein kinase